MYRMRSLLGGTPTALIPGIRPRKQQPLELQEVKSRQRQRNECLKRGLSRGQFQPAELTKSASLGVKEEEVSLDL